MLSFILSALVPIFTDFAKSAAPAVSRKVFGESVDDTIKLAQSDISRVEALSKLDNPYGTPSQWVVDLRGSFRYLAAGVLILGGVGLAIYGAANSDPEFVVGGLDMASSPFGFIFGERLVLSFKGSTK